MSPREWRWRAQNSRRHDDLFSRLDDEPEESETSGVSAQPGRQPDGVVASGKSGGGGAAGASAGGPRVCGAGRAGRGAVTMGLAESPDTAAVPGAVESGPVDSGQGELGSGDSSSEGNSGMGATELVPIGPTPAGKGGVEKAEPVPVGPTPAGNGGVGVDPSAGNGSEGNGSGGRKGGSRARGPAGPLPLPDGPRFVRVTLDFTPDEYVVWEQVEQIVRGQLRKRARRVEVALAMAEAARASAGQRTKARHQVILHVDAETGEGWYDTDRGLIPARPEKVSEAFEEGQVVVSSSAPTSETPDPKPAKTVTVGVTAALYARAGGRCEVCQARGLLHVHHRKPRCRGGTNELSNLELRCSACHTMTHEKDHRENPDWRAARQRKSGPRRPARRSREASG